MRAIVVDESHAREVRFGALYCLLVHLNRQERTAAYAELVRSAEAEFGLEPYFDTFRALVAYGRGIGGQPELLRVAIDFARRAAADLPGHVGIQHQVAMFAVDYLELEGAKATTGLLEEADRTISLVLSSPQGRRAHYFETRSRVSALQGEYGSARVAIAEAIAAEPDDDPDVYRRLARYQATRVRIDLLEERARTHAQQESFRQELDRFRTQQVELLGLLAAVVAFVASAASIAAQSAKAADGARLMCAMAGAVILVFTTFAYTNASPPWARVIPPALLGAALLLVSVLVGG
ncbi:hypothetical protein KDL01_34465 [Actinospica durhamensis]|uniref:Uncharacterized protein n=1 Tax=Actinospica durhamensis TaxID=1508375 RepID=A0A941ISE8_9ACTN|nr:hypothetical protein [Actinospica durhamensis]MBR7838424.1 hypothetical protein [Actinospica durhamensis]